MAEPKENEFLDDIEQAEAEEYAQSLDELEDEAVELEQNGELHPVDHDVHQLMAVG